MPTPSCPAHLRMLLAQLKLELEQLAEQIDEADTVIAQIARENEACRRLVAIPGIGPVTATALIAAIGNGAAFQQGPGVCSLAGGGSRRTLNRRQAEAARHQQARQSYLRRLFVQGRHGSHADRTKQSSGLSAWLAQLTSRNHITTSPSWRWPTSWRAWPGRCSPKDEAYRPPLLAALLQHDWPADDAWLEPGLEIAARFPHPQTSDDYDGTEFMSSCQVCWRTMRWHNGRTRRSQNLIVGKKSFQDCSIK